MRKILSTLAVLGTVMGTLALHAAAQDSPSAKSAPSITDSTAQIPQDIAVISRAFGHIIGQNLESLGLDFNMQELIKGVQDSLSNVESPMSEAECIQAISLIQEHAAIKQSQVNLQQAESFLAQNKSAAGIVELEEGKLQYVRLQEGRGAEVQLHDAPVIRYTGSFLDGKIFGESHEDEVISLDDTIVGFSKAIVGMKEGEKRKIFIHPELGYGTTGYFPPNSLLCFEIEVIKASQPQAVEESALTFTKRAEPHSEELSSSHFVKEEAIR